MTTVADMALFAREAMKMKLSGKIVSTYEYTIPATELQPEARLIHNSNRLRMTKCIRLSSAMRHGRTNTMEFWGSRWIYRRRQKLSPVAAAERDGMTLIGEVYRSEPKLCIRIWIQLLDFDLITLRWWISG